MKYYNANQASDKLGISRPVIIKMIRQKELKVEKKKGVGYRIPESEIKRLERKLKQTSLIYKYPSLYTWFIKLLYRRHYTSRYRAISDEIEDNTSVIDICCGDCALYVQALKNRVSYTGIDINPYFISRAAHLSINVRLLDVFKDTLPDADYVIMQGSLYQFIPHHKKAATQTKH